MKNLSIDIETYSSVDLSKCGVYKYVESDDFQILLFAYSIDYGKVQVIDLACGEDIPEEVIKALDDKNVKKWAFNANFERICLSKYLNKELSPLSWRCTMVWCATLGLPLSMDKVGEVLKLENKKLKEGKNLIKYFCSPYKESEATCKDYGSNNKRIRNLPIHDIDKWEKFKEYNKRDVYVELDIQRRLAKFPVSEREWENYEIDQFINDRGIMLDMEFVKNAIDCDKKHREEVITKAKELTNIKNPNSTYQLKKWLETKGIKTTSLSKASVDKILKDVDKSLKNSKAITNEVNEVNEIKEVKEVLNLRRELSKSSVKKYVIMETVVNKDNRSRGLIQFYGGSKTGRFAGRLIQVHNLPQNHMKDLQVARSLVKSGNFEALDFLYDSRSSVLSELIRTAFVPKKGHKFVIADFSSIEARVLAYMANEKWRLDVFEKDKDIYLASAREMFKKEVATNGMSQNLRQKGKIAELALGYGGGVGALRVMGATKMGIEEEELQTIVNSWRNANMSITRFWWGIDRAVKNVILTKNPIKVYEMSIFYEDNMLFIVLPSKRKLCYRNPEIITNKFNGTSVTYEGIGSNHKYVKIETYGPKFVENIVQGISRDLLCEAMKNLRERGFEIVMHVHDEVVVEVCEGKDLQEEVCNIMSIPPSWATDLKLMAKGFESYFYKKD